MSKSAAQTLANGLPISLRSALIVAVGAALMTLSAKIQIPFWPVPMNLQTMAVMGFAIGLGPRMAVAVVAAYLAAGAYGLPVFAGAPERGIGIVYLIGPTGGYLAGMLAASWITGLLGAGRGLIGRVGAMLVGMGLVYSLGIAWLALYVPSSRLVMTGILPFILADLVKIGIVAAGASLATSVKRAAKPAG
jgi:biotin transport system substrate-specific component